MRDVQDKRREGNVSSSWFMYIQSLFRSDDKESEQADMTNSNMSLVCLSRFADTTVNLDSVFAEGVAAIIPSKSDETATFDY